jgi:predicted transcriptional regulator
MGQVTLCKNCLEQIISKLTPNDVYVLYRLRDKTNGMTGDTRSQIFETLSDRMSVFQLSQSLMRLELVGLIGEFKAGKNTLYFITQNGQSVLGILSNQ